MLLVPTTLEQLCKAHFFTNVDLMSPYNLIRVSEGDK